MNLPLAGENRAPVFGAESQSPPLELVKFDVMLDSWEGSGVTHASPGDAGTRWTAVSTTTKILDGNFVDRCGGEAPPDKFYESKMVRIDEEDH